jgi:hypothetical protein
VLSVWGDGELKAVIDEHRAWIADEVLATELVFNAPSEATQGRQSIDLDGFTAYVAITRIQ